MPDLSDEMVAEMEDFSLALFLCQNEIQQQLIEQQQQ